MTQKIDILTMFFCLWDPLCDSMFLLWLWCGKKKKSPYCRHLPNRKLPASVLFATPMCYFSAELHRNPSTPVCKMWLFLFQFLSFWKILPLKHSLSDDPGQAAAFTSHRENPWRSS
jgi:hypothetical protein